MACHRHQHRGRRCRRAAHRIQRRRPTALHDQPDGQQQMLWRLAIAKHRKLKEKTKQVQGAEGDSETSLVGMSQW